MRVNAASRVEAAARMTARKIVLIFAFGLLGIAALRDLGRLGDALPWHRLYDFQDFYCAGEAVDQHADPYRYEPLHRCEHRVNASEAYRLDPNRVVPAPQPPYDFPPFQLVARMAFPSARILAAWAITGAVVAAVAGLALAGVPLDVAALALALPAGYLLLDAGQIVPFALAALVWSGVALQRRRDVLAGVLGALTVLEPHLGLPVFIALLVAVPKGRLGALATAAFLAGVATWTVGGATLLEYVTRVLPAHAAAETQYVYQYSLTYFLASLHAPAAVALIAGDLSYAAALIGGIWLGAALSAGLKRRELIAYVPAATVLLGGSFVHMVDLAMAIPAAAVLAVALPERPRRIAALALVLLSVPWIPVWIVKKLFLASLFVTAALLIRLVGGVLAVGAFGAIALTIYGFELRPPAGFEAFTPGSPPGALAQYAWGAYLAHLRSNAFGWLAIKIPTWSALSALLAAELFVVTARARPNR